MAKHRKPSNNVARNAAAASAVAVGATAVLANPAQAAEVYIPNTGLSFEVAGIENIQGIENIPGIEQWIPSLSGQAGTNYNAVVAGPNAAPSVPTGQQIVDIARSKIGSPYVWGAAGPNAFDCSGFTTWVYSQVGKAIPRTSYAQAAGGQKVSFDQLQAGDIIAFYAGASHVGIYSGHGTVIHALNEGTPLAETSLEYMPFHSATRY